MPTESTALARNPMVVVNAETIELPTRARVAPRPWRDLPAGRGGRTPAGSPSRREEERLPDPPHGGEEKTPYRIPLLGGEGNNHGAFSGAMAGGGGNAGTGFVIGSPSRAASESLAASIVVIAVAASLSFMNTGCP